jgi:hypothetical protein
VIDNIHLYAKSGKQVLLYTLLDYMHKQDMFFILIGLSNCSHLGTLFEKRVSSRIDSHFICLNPLSADDICQYYSSNFSIDVEQFETTIKKNMFVSFFDIFNTKSIGKSKGIVTEVLDMNKKRKLKLNRENYHEWNDKLNEYNAMILKLFGEYHQQVVPSAEESENSGS